MQKEKLTVIFTVLVDVIGFGIVIPILPFYVSSFGASAFTITLLFSTFAFFAFLSSPFLGALSDKIGRRPVLLLSICSTAIGWYVFAAANSIPLLFLGRIIDGAAAGNFTVAQSCLVDISTDKKDRAANLGLIGATFGIGFMVGPLLGGVLSTVSHSFPFWFAGILATVNTIIAFFFLPETHHKRNTAAVLSFNPIAPIGRALMDVRLRPLFLRWVLFALAFMASQSVFALYAQSAFGLDAFATGMLFTAIGVFTALNQAVLLKYVWLKYFSEERLEVLTTVVLGISFLLMGMRIPILFYIGVPLLASSQSVLRVVITSRTAGIAEPHVKGEVIGTLTSLMAASMVIAPAVAGILFEIYDNIPYLVGCSIMILSLLIIPRVSKA